MGVVGCVVLKYIFEKKIFIAANCIIRKGCIASNVSIREDLITIIFLPAGLCASCRENTRRSFVVKLEGEYVYHSGQLSCSERMSGILY